MPPATAEAPSPAVESHKNERLRVGVIVDQTIRPGQLSAIAEVVSDFIEVVFIVSMEPMPNASQLEKLAYERQHSSVFQLMLPGKFERPNDPVFGVFLDHGKELKVIDTPRDDEGDIDIDGLVSSITTLAPAKPFNPPTKPGPASKTIEKPDDDKPAKNADGNIDKSGDTASKKSGNNPK